MPSRWLGEPQHMPTSAALEELSEMLDAGLGGKVLAGCDDISHGRAAFSDLDWQAGPTRCLQGLFKIAKGEKV